jgi:hypothetical protein
MRCASSTIASTSSNVSDGLLTRVPSGFHSGRAGEILRGVDFCVVDAAQFGRAPLHASQGPLMLLPSVKP